MQSATPRPDWKSRFSEKQLERKRLIDRLSQRKSRNQTKREVAELEERLRLLVEWNDNDLIHRLMQENAALRASLERFKTKMESISLCSRMCLEESEEQSTDPCAPRRDDKNSKRRAWPQQKAPSGKPEQRETARGPLSGSSYVLDALPFHWLQESIIFRAAAVIGWNLRVERRLSVDTIVESIVAWKLKQGYGLGFDFLVEHLNLDKAPASLTTETIKRRAQSKSLYKDIHRQLLSKCLLPAPPPGEEGDAPLDTIVGIDLHKRALAICAFEGIKQYSALFVSALEMASVFWVQYKFLTFLTLPTESNLRKTPRWLLPTSAQLSFDHPAYIDSVVWPKMREKLTTTWQQYNSDVLIAHIVNNLEIRKEGIPSIDPLRVKPNQSDLEIDEEFEIFISNLGNFALRQPFSASFPELYSCQCEPPGGSEVEGSIQSCAQKTPLSSPSPRRVANDERERLREPGKDTSHTQDTVRHATSRNDTESPWFGSQMQSNSDRSVFDGVNFTNLPGNDQRVMWYMQTGTDTQPDPSLPEIATFAGHASEDFYTFQLPGGECLDENFEFNLG